MTTPTTVALSSWLQIATKVHQKWSNEYDLAVDRNNKALLEAKQNHSHLPDNAWQPLHRAFTRKEASRMFLEIILELKKEMGEEDQREVEVTGRVQMEVSEEAIRKFRSDAGLDIQTTHTNINTTKEPK